MCQLCGTDEAEKKRARDEHYEVARRLDQLSAMYRGLANGSIKPHSDDMKDFDIRLRLVLRAIAADI